MSAPDAASPGPQSPLVVPEGEPAAGPPAQRADATVGLGPLVGYFLKLGALGFGGPVALVGYMHRDLVERRRWIDEDTYTLALALSQIMPGPLAAQCAIALGFLQHGIVGATAAATGAISGAVVVLAQRAIFDLPTAAIGLASLAVLWRYKVPEPFVVLAAAAAGLALWPLVR
jgi:chromate transport protein ChrA